LVQGFTVLANKDPPFWVSALVTKVYNSVTHVSGAVASLNLTEMAGYPGGDGAEVSIAHDSSIIYATNEDDCVLCDCAQSLVLP